VDRAAFLEQCRNLLPGLSFRARWCYTSPSNLVFENQSISSEVGVQQVDPLGPLLFALALQPVLQELAAQSDSADPNGLELVFPYLDDCCLAGGEEAVARALATLKSSTARLGLQLCPDKCELIPAAGPNASINASLFPSHVATRADACFELLGGPVGNEESCNGHMPKRVAKATELLKAIGELPDLQVALMLLRQCASFGKLVYSARVVPPAHTTQP